MIDQDEILEQWEIGRAGKPLDFPNLAFMKLAVLVSARMGSRERHRHLQDLTDLLTPYHDADYKDDMDQARETRDRISSGEMPEGIDRKEAVDAHQRLWLAALMRMLKRRGLLGETWIRG